MKGCVYGRHEIYKFDRNWVSVENGELAVPVNNTLVCHIAFLAADTRPCVLINHKIKLTIILKS